MRLEPRWWVPVLTGLAIASVVLVLWRSLVAGEARLVETETQARAAAYASQLQQALSERLEGLERMQKRWQFRRPTRAEWESDAGAYLSDSTLHYALEWIDEDGELQWIIPSSYTDVSLAAGASREEAFQRARETRTTQITGPLDLDIGGRGFLMCMPLYRGDMFEGLLVAAFRFEVVLAAVDLQADDDVISRITVADEVVHEAAVEGGFRSEPVVFDVGGRPWSLELVSHAAAHGHSLAKSLLLIVGLAFAGMAAAFLSRHYTVRGQARALERAHQDLLMRTQQLEAVNRELDGFTYSVSHDLRAPLRAVYGFAQILVEDHGYRLDEEGQRVLHVIQRNVTKMGQLIDDLLRFSRTGRRELERERVDMKKLAEEELAALREEAVERAIEVELPALPAANGDPALLRQVWSNLLSNAVKYTRDRSPAVIEIRGRAENGELVYSVHDNGVGFDPRYAGKLFGVFQRLHKSSEFEGVGVGLALVQRIVARHGGRVWAEAQPERGASFYFTLPRDTAHG